MPSPGWGTLSRLVPGTGSRTANETGCGVDLNTSLGYLLKQAHNVLRSEMDAALRPLGMTVPQYACLELSLSDPVSPTPSWPAARSYPDSR
jgi:hypothetical protein